MPGNGTATVKEYELPALGEEDVLIEIRASAICRSDMSLYHGRPLLPGAGAFIPGHEPAGVVVETGRKVRRVTKGDRVAVCCFVGCGYCEWCQRGEPYLCDQVEVLGFHRHGGDAEYLVVPENVCLPIPEEMSYRTAAIATDAIGNVYNTMKELKITGADTIAIIGLGPTIGLPAVLVASHLGCEVIAVDVIEARLKAAAELGASIVINAAKDNVREKIKTLTKGKGVAKIIEASGSQEGLSLALDIVAKQGYIAQIGEIRTATFSPSDYLIRKKITYFGSWYFRMWEWPEIVDFIINRIGDAKAQRIISHVFRLTESDVKEAFRLFDERKTLKVVFEPFGEEGSGKA
ncbi:MAG: alcohol dehydrogenase catalytic domain-containing protein [Candidatus Bathyarchaeia archaeon]